MQIPPARLGDAASEEQVVQALTDLGVQRSALEKEDVEAGRESESSVDEETLLSAAVDAEEKAGLSPPELRDDDDDEVEEVGGGEEEQKPAGEEETAQRQEEPRGMIFFILKNLCGSASF